MKRCPTLKDRTRFRTIVLHRPHGNPDQKWFISNPDRIYRIRPERHDEPNIGYLILERLSYGSCLGVDIGHVGAMLTDDDETLSKVYRYLRCKKEGMIFPHDGTVLGEDELGP